MCVQIDVLKWYQIAFGFQSYITWYDTFFRISAICLQKCFLVLTSLITGQRWISFFKIILPQRVTHLVSLNSLRSWPHWSWRHSLYFQLLTTKQAAAIWPLWTNQRSASLGTPILRWCTLHSCLQSCHLSSHLKQHGYRAFSHYIAVGGYISQTSIS